MTEKLGICDTFDQILNSCMNVIVLISVTHVENVIPSLRIMISID